MKRLMFSLLLLFLLSVSLVSAEMFVDEDNDVIVSIYEDFFWTNGDSFSIYVSDTGGTFLCSDEVYGYDFVSGYVTDEYFFYDYVRDNGDSINYVTDRMTLDGCVNSDSSIFSVTAEPEEYVSCEDDSDCSSDGICGTNEEDGHYGVCVTCVEDDEGADYETPGTVVKGLWGSTGTYVSDRSDYCQDESTLVEYYCLSGHAGYYPSVTCSDEVGEGSVCVENSDGVGYCTSVEDENDVEEEKGEEERPPRGGRSARAAENPDFVWWNPLSWF